MIFFNLDLTPLLLTFELAALTTLILFMLGLPLGYWLAFSHNRFKPVFEASVSMPLVLPPSVLGFYLLLAFSPQQALGQWLGAKPRSRVRAYLRRSLFQRRPPPRRRPEAQHRASLRDRSWNSGKYRSHRASHLRQDQPLHRSQEKGLHPRPSSEAV